MTSTTVPGTARTRTDRRRRPTPMLSRYWLRGRRRGGRRIGETGQIYVDRYQRVEVLLFLSILLLSAVDLGLTLLHLDAGGAEANPILAWFVGPDSVSGLVIAKAFATLLGGLVLLLHVRFKRVRAALVCLVLVYGALMLWHGVVAVDRLLVDRLLV